MKEAETKFRKARYLWKRVTIMGLLAVPVFGLLMAMIMYFFPSHNANLTPESMLSVVAISSGSLFLPTILALVSYRTLKKGEVGVLVLYVLLTLVGFAYSFSELIEPPFAFSALIVSYQSWWWVVSIRLVIATIKIQKERLRSTTYYISSVRQLHEATTRSQLDETYGTLSKQYRRLRSLLRPVYKQQCRQLI